MIDLNNLKLVVGRQPILMQPAEKFDFSNPPCDPIALSEAMVKIMEEYKGYGLSACQVGLPYSVFVISGDPYACFNPKVVGVSDELIQLEEGCLSFPGVAAPIVRPRHLRLRYTNPLGVTETKQFTGMTARVILHEMDHLNGVLFYNHLPLVKRERLLKQFTKAMKHGKATFSPKNSFFNTVEHSLHLAEVASRNQKSRAG